MAKKQRTVLHMTSSKSYSKGEGDEPERRGYDKKKYEALNRKKNENNYDYSRKYLNFEVVKGKIVPQCSHSKGLTDRLEERLRELGFKHFKDGSKNAPNCIVNFMLSGSRETMRRLAFGDQDVCYDRTRPNVGIQRKEDIENFALDAYRFVCDKYGEKNIVGFNVHLDETNPHIHVDMVPVAMVKQRGRRKPGEEPKMKESVSYYKLIGETAAERKAYEEHLHTEFWMKVGLKYGLERGYFYDELSDEEKLNRKHKNKTQLEEERVLRERIEQQKKILSENEKIIQKQNASIKQAETRVKGLTTMVTHQEEKLASLDEKSKEYDEILAKLQEKRELLEKAEKQLVDIRNDIAELSETNYHLSRNNEELVKKNHQLASEISSLRAESNRLDEAIKSKREGLQVESPTLMQRRNQKNSEARLNIIYKMWPLAVSAVQAIYDRASKTSARMFSFQQGNSIWQALNVMSDKMEAAECLNELARESFIEKNLPEKWFSDAANEVLTLAENFAELSAVFLIPANGQSMGGGGGGNNDLPKKKDDDREGRFYTIMSRGKGRGVGR